MSCALAQFSHVALQQQFHLPCFVVGASHPRGDSTGLCDEKGDSESDNAKVLQFCKQKNIFRVSPTTLSVVGNFIFNMPKLLPETFL